MMMTYGDFKVVPDFAELRTRLSRAWERFDSAVNEQDMDEAGREVEAADIAMDRALAMLSL